MIQRLLVATLGLALGACSSTAELQVHTRFENGFDFSDAKTFRMASTTPDAEGRSTYPRYDRMIREEVERELIGRGYVRADDGDVTDMRVAATLKVSGERGGPTDSFSDIHERTQGVPAVARGTNRTNTLIVEISDPASSAIVWSGQVSGFAIGATDARATFRKAVWRLLAEFPPIVATGA